MHSALRRRGCLDCILELDGPAQVYGTEWLSKLSDKHRMLVERRFGLNHHDIATLKELAKVLEVFRERVPRILLEAQEKRAI